MSTAEVIQLSDYMPTEQDNREMNVVLLVQAAHEVMAAVRANPVMYSKQRENLVEARFKLGKALFAIDEIRPEYQLRFNENSVPEYNVWQD